MHIGERDVALPHGTLCDLACHDLRVKTRRALFNEEAANVAIVIACPDNRHVGKGGVANPALGSIDDILVSCAMSARLQRHESRRHSTHAGAAIALDTAASHV